MSDVSSTDMKFINAIADSLLTAPPEPINDKPITDAVVAYDEKLPHLTSSIRSTGLIRRSGQINEMLATHERSLQSLLDKVRGGANTGNGRDFPGEKDMIPSGLVSAFDLIERKQKSCAKLLQDLIDTF